MHFVLGLKNQREPMYGVLIDYSGAETSNERGQSDETINDVCRIHCPKIFWRYEELCAAFIKKTPVPFEPRLRPVPKI